MEAVVHTTTMGADVVSEVLMNAGAVGTSIEDRYDVTSSKKEDGMWDMIDEEVLARMSEDVLVRAYFKNDASVQETLLLVSEKLGELKRLDMGFDMGSLTLEHQNVQEQDWAENWKKYYKPFRAGERLVIKPSWEHYEQKEGDLVLELDPGMAFGTGTHETTFMCMEQLEKYVTPGAKVLDLGTGSGILGITALKLGADYVYGTDLDENAITAVHENLAANDIPEDKFGVIQGNIIDDKAVQDAAGYECYDIAVANILADIIIMIQEEVPVHIKKGGIFITSGIIDMKEQAVKDALAKNDAFEIIETTYQGEWVSITCRKK